MHKAKINNTLNLEEQVGGADKLNIYYMCMGTERFNEFVTEPVDPTAQKNKSEYANCKHWHLRAGRLNKEVFWAETTNSSAESSEES